MSMPAQGLWALIAAAVGLVFAIITARSVTSKDRGNDKMKEIQDTTSPKARWRS